jgi:2-keto-4-pentenoate hydratase/2-oxohepta-3-ene-1,7-dioic acid hydratase in catechol pathway
MVYKLPRIIHEFSVGATLEPGDVIITGTPSGVGFARKPPEFLKAGDLMEMEIEKIGVLRNRVAAYSPAAEREAREAAAVA